MADVSDGDHHSGPAAGHLGRRRAAGIYGAIITAAILAAVGKNLATSALVVSVVVTLVVYWLAEEYAELLGEHTAGGLPSWGYIRGALSATWPMVSASFAPLVAVVLARLAGASTLTAVNIGLATAVVMLTGHGWAAGRAAKLHGRQLFFTTAIAAVLGVVMILLKNLILVHLH